MRKVFVVETSCNEVSWKTEKEMGLQELWEISGEHGRCMELAQDLVSWRVLY
jgi:hypothetical protein